MSHVAPHQWADVAAGKIVGALRAKLERHADGCATCAAARTRIAKGRATFVELRAEAAPELPWDSIRARVHWEISKERNTRETLKVDPAPRWPKFVVAGGLAVAAIAGVVFAVTRSEDAPPSTIAAPAPQQTPPIATPAPVAPLALVGTVNRVGGDVMIGGLRSSSLDEPFARALRAGDVIATGDGRIDVQFGDGSAFALAPRSTLELRRFDAQMIELVIEGTVDIEVGPRAVDQRFVVHAGARDVEVRGTQFRVAHDRETTTVACLHGVVAVREKVGAPVEVRAAQRVTVPIAKPVTDERAVSLTTDELESLAASTPYALPVWPPAATVALDVTGSRDVRVDGIEHGAAPMRVRVLPGRHTIEAADHKHRFHRIGFVDAAPDRVASFAVPALAAPRPTVDIGPRKRQLASGLDRVRLARCVRAITKSGLPAGKIEIEIAVDANGAIGVLNVDSDLPLETARCIRGVLADVAFGAGVAAEWRATLDLDKP